MRALRILAGVIMATMLVTKLLALEDIPPSPPEVISEFVPALEPAPVPSRNPRLRFPPRTNSLAPNYGIRPPLPQANRLTSRPPLQNPYNPTSGAFSPATPLADEP